MLFKELLFKYDHEIKLAFDKLFKQCLKNQNHEGNLLLLYTNGYSDKTPKHLYAKNKKDEYSYFIGLDHIGLSEDTHYEFIRQYRELNISLDDYETFKNKLDKDNRLSLKENISIQIEMLIYLKIFESDLFIKSLYEISRIVNGLNYDWHFKIAESSRDKDSTGTRQEIIRKKIRDKLKSQAADVSSILTSIYKTQIRNSIAHSNYSILNRTIHLNNYIENDKASQLKNITFDKWNEIFHRLMIFYNYYIDFMNRCHNYYRQKVMFGEKMKVLVTEQSGEEYEIELKYRAQFEDWIVGENNYR